MIKREEKFILCTKYYYIRVFVLVIINGTLFYLRDNTGRLKSNQIKHCKLWNVSRGEKSKKRKVQIGTQNEKIVETDVLY